MQNVKDALFREVDVCREMLKLHDAMASCGYPENPFWDNFSTASDAIYKLIGEHTETFEESVTYLVLTAPYLTNERRAEMLYAEYLKNFPLGEQNHASENVRLTSDEIDFLNQSQSCYVTSGRQQDKFTPT